MAAKHEGKKKPGGQTKRNEVTEAKILAVLDTGLSYKTAAEAAGVSETTLHRWRREDPEFDAECKAASAKAKTTMRHLPLGR